MKLTVYGNELLPGTWKVEQSKPAGYCRIYYITGGKVWYEDEKGRRDLKNHSLYFFPSVKSYNIYHDPDNPMFCLWCHVDLFPTVVSELIEIPVEKQGSLWFFLETLRSYYMESGGQSGAFCSLVEALMEYCYDHGWIQKSSGRISEILEYMDANYNQPIGIEEISHHFNYTPEHFIRMFQKEMNLTPYQYLIHRRMREAGNLLLRGTSVKETARIVGYQDAKVFAYRFRQTFMTAPSQYRKFYNPTA